MDDLFVPEMSAGTTTPQLLELPAEILNMIFSLVEKKKDMYHLLQTCRQVHDLMLPIIWKEIEFQVWNDKKQLPDFYRADRILKATAGHLNLLQYVKGVVVAGMSDPTEWCPHQGRKGDTYFTRMGSDILLMLAHLQENSLKHFSWTAGTCLPTDILGTFGYLPAKQKSIESLSLVISGNCHKKLTDSLSLSQFTKLKSFSLKGARSDFEAKAVMNVLRASSENLISFELEVCPSYGWRWAAEKIFPLAPPLLTLAKLRSLSLSYVTFGSEIGKELTQSIDFASLTSLTLRRCRGWAQVFQEACAEKKSMALRWFEIQYDEARESDVAHLIEMLGCCQNLIDVSVCHGEDILSLTHLTTFAILKAACLDKPYLRGLVFHMFDFQTDNDVPSPAPDPKSPVLKDRLKLLLRTSASISIPKKNPLGHVDLDFLGLCCFPNETLQALLLPFKKKDCLRTIHIRKSSMDWRQFEDYHVKVREFARWVFGREGIPSVNNLMLGNFSTRESPTNKRVRAFNYVRIAEYPFYELTPDARLDDVLQKYKELAMTCPMCTA